MQRIVILASGSGSNAERIMAYFAGSEVARVVAVVSDRRGAGVFARAAGFGVEGVWLSPKLREAPGGLLGVLRERSADLVVLAGYLRLVPEDVVAGFPGRVINIHPALLPHYGGPGMYGRHVHEAVVAAGERVSGITIHLADEVYDRGRVLFQATTPVPAGADAEALAKAVLLLEHRHFPHVLAAYARQLNASMPQNS